MATSRLRLRRFDDGDLPLLTELFADHSVRRYLAVGRMDRVAALDFAAEFIRRSEGELSEAGCGALALTRKADGRPIGYCGLRPLPDRIRAVELLYAVAPDCWGNGYASEAARAVVDWGFAVLLIDEIHGFTRPEHGASRRIMEKLGMRYRGDTDRYYGETLAFYALGRCANGSNPA
ncbi:MAG: GNAT family N-acetyltransferase [Alphaproteobacteria bacterium]|nr:GNAT family N-acetyltransferase [Alphaproteobacteria bacterium]MDP6567558.1 GNAT family N-acetyltransferase [Alphaproteobacteria bacterium]MDP6812772.1 GNAT family N-acetyltransferase [Alphaproteobacteria bacterium]